jgi:hypothetical protein
MKKVMNQVFGDVDERKTAARKLQTTIKETGFNMLCPIAQYAINDAKSTATGETPNFITFGIESEDENIPHQEKMKIIHEKVNNVLEWTEKKPKEILRQKSRESDYFGERG